VHAAAERDTHTPQKGGSASQRIRPLQVGGIHCGASPPWQECPERGGPPRGGSTTVGGSTDQGLAARGTMKRRDGGSCLRLFFPTFLAAAIGRPNVPMFVHAKTSSIRASFHQCKRRSSLRFGRGPLAINRRFPGLRAHSFEPLSSIWGGVPGPDRWWSLFRYVAAPRRIVVSKCYYTVPL